MDPQAAWDQMLDALVNSEWELAAEGATALLGWLDRNGFPPRITGSSRPGLGPELDRKLAYAGCRYARRFAQAATRRKHP